MDLVLRRQLANNEKAGFSTESQNAEIEDELVMLLIAVSNEHPDQIFSGRFLAAKVYTGIRNNGYNSWLGCKISFPLSTATG
jgi:hypothetical protein